MTSASSAKADLVALPESVDGVSAGRHTLVVYSPSARADAALRSLASAASRANGRVTVLSLAVQEPESKGCCDTRSVYWNRVRRELARDDLARASLALGGESASDFDVLLHAGRGAADALTDEALRRDADEILLADPRRCPLGFRERRRLRRHSPVPVSH